MSNFNLLAVSALVLSGISTTQAATFNNTTGLTGVGITPTFTVNFNGTPGLVQNSPITNQYAFAGVTFSTPAFYDGNNNFGGCAFNDLSGDCITNFSANATGLTSTPTTPFSILFATPQSFAAFALVTGNNGTNNTTITAFRNNVLVESFTVTTGSGANQPATVPNYFGFYNEATAFNRITLTTSGSNLVILDNIQLQAIPEPATVGLFSLGIGGILIFARRRRSA